MSQEFTRKRTNPLMLLASLLSFSAGARHLDCSSGSIGGGTKKKATKGGTKGAFGKCRNNPAPVL